MTDDLESQVNLLDPKIRKALESLDRGIDIRAEAPNGDPLDADPDVPPLQEDHSGEGDTQPLVVPVPVNQDLLPRNVESDQIVSSPLAEAPFAHGEKRRHEESESVPLKSKQSRTGNLETESFDQAGAPRTLGPDMDHVDRVVSSEASASPTTAEAKVATAETTKTHKTSGVRKRLEAIEITIEFDEAFLAEIAFASVDKVNELPPRRFMEKVLHEVQTNKTAVKHNAVPARKKRVEITERNLTPEEYYNLS